MRSRNDAAIGRAVGVGIVFGFAVLAILGALFDVVDDELAAIFVAAGMVFAVAIGLVGRRG